MNRHLYLSGNGRFEAQFGEGLSCMISQGLLRSWFSTASMLVSPRYVLLYVLGPTMLRWMTMVSVVIGIGICYVKFSVVIGIGTCYVKVDDNGSGVSRDGLVLIRENYGYLFAKCWTAIIFSIVLMLL
ncbi:uncharacterized protein LOC129872093 [Solanum dulcamara]|uniref:uncharacterized protein LOC129872093 n=1 Tax=Solanum dulcamara TaxID=45834 RepID=UPI0024869C3B|nr:uncharacterized protein LOC129872093 [Solanum dulcamara]